MSLTDLVQINNLMAENKVLKARVSELEKNISDLGFTELTQANASLSELNKEITLAEKKLNDTLARAEAAYNSSFRAGVLCEKARNTKELSHIFKRMGVVNRFSNSPILNLEDYYKWEAAFDAAKRERKRKENNNPQGGDFENHSAPQSTDQEMTTEPYVHYLLSTKSDSAFETIVEFSYSINEKLNNTIPITMLEPSVYIISSALCVWAEQFLKQEREWSIECIDMLSAEFGNRADALKETMLSAAGTVRSAIINLDREHAVTEFSTILMKLLMVEKNISVSSCIPPLLISFSASYITNMQHCV